MSAKWQRVKIEIPEDYGPQERRAIATEIVDFIRTRTQKKRVDKNNHPFAKYSPDYVKSLDFKIAGKSKGKIDLTLSGDMLGALDVIATAKGQVTVGFENGSQENARADGNIRGTYGKKPGTGPSRDFLGIAQEDLERILKRYPVDNPDKTNSRVSAVLQED